MSQSRPLSAFVTSCVSWLRLFSPECILSKRCTHTCALLLYSAIWFRSERDPICTQPERMSTLAAIYQNTRSKRALSTTLLFEGTNSTSVTHEESAPSTSFALQEPQLDLLVQASRILELHPGKHTWPEAILRAIHRICVRTKKDVITTKELREEEFENIKVEVGVNEKEGQGPKTPSRTLSAVLTKRLARELRILERETKGVYKVDREALKKELEKIS